MANLIKIDTTGYTSDYILLLDSPSSVGRYVTVKDTGTNPTFFASNAIVISTTSGYTFFDGNSTEYIRTNKGSLSFLTTTSNWRLLNTVPYTTLGHAVLSTISTKNMSVFGGVSSFAQVTVQNTMQVQAIDTQNVATVNAIPVVTASNMASTVAGLGTLAYLSSISFMNNYFASTVNGLGTYGIISSSLLTSSMKGLGPPYVSSTWLTSTMQGLGTLGYVSYSQFNSSIIGITLGFRSNIGSTVSGLGTFGYISSQSLISSIRDLGQEPYTYISSKQLQSTTAGITTFNTATLVSTVQGLGQIYISTQGLVSTTVGISNVNATNITSTINNLGRSYISSLSLQSTVAGLGTLGYISISQLTSTMIGLSNATIAANTSIDNLGTNQYISAPSLVSSVVGLGSAPYSYISGPSLVSTVNGLGSVLLSTPSLLQKATALTNSVYNTSAITSTMNGLGNYYLSTSGDYTVVGRLGVYLGGINGITRAGNTPTNRTVTTVASGFNYPVGVAVDSTGVYVADLANNLIRLYTPAGVSTYASVSSPGGLAIDPAGNIYISRLYVGLIVKIDPFRNQTTIASGISFPYGLAIDSRGIVYIVAFGTSEIYQLIGGVLSRLAGSGSGFADGDANSAQFNGPYSVAVDSADNIFVADTGNGRIRQIKSSLVISLVQATSVPGYMVMDGAGNIYYTIPGLHVIMKRDTAGNVTTYAGSGIPGSADGIPGSFFNPQGLAIDSAGNIYVADRKNNAVRKVDTGRNVTTVFSGGTYPNALNWPQGVAVDSSGIYVADTGNSRICSIPGSLLPPLVSTLAGSGAIGSADGTAAGASFKYPGYLVLYAGNIYVTDANHRIRKITPAGVVTTFAGSGQGYADGTGTGAAFDNPQGIEIDSAGNIYVADTLNHRIRKITPAAVVTTFAGSGAIGSVDGTGTGASFSYPTKLGIDSAGNIYVTDANHRIRKITPAGVVTTFAGSDVQGYADGTGVAASFRYLADIVGDSAGNIYVADGGNNRIRKITSTGVVTTFAGSGAAAYADGTGTAASLYDPQGLGIDSAGNIYVTQSGDHRIRKITPTAVVTTIAGIGVSGSADGPVATASFFQPIGILIDSTGIIYIGDMLNQKIRKITGAATPTINVIAGASYTTPPTPGPMIPGPTIPTLVTTNLPGNAAISYSGTIRLNDSGGYPIGIDYHPYGRVGNSLFIDTFRFTYYPYSSGAVDSEVYIGYFVLNPPFLYDYLYPQVSPWSYFNPFTDSYTLSDCLQAYWVRVGQGYIYKTFNNPGAPLTLTLWGAYHVWISTNPDPTRTIYIEITGNTTISINNLYSTNTSGCRFTFPNIIIPSGSFTIKMYVSSADTGVQDDGGNRRTSWYLSLLDTSTPYVYDANRTVPYTEYYWTDSSWGIGSAVLTNVPGPLVPGPDIPGTIGPLAGYADGNGTAAQFNGPRGIRLDASHNIYVADTGNNMIRKVDPSANVTTIAGQVTAGLTNGVGAAAQFNFPTDVALDGTSMYVADYANNVIRKIDSTQKVTIYGGSPVGASGNSLTPPGLFSGPIGVFVSGSYLYFTEEGNSDIKRMFGGTVVSTVASGLSSPTAIAFDSAGTMYVTDNNRVITIPNTAYAGTGFVGSADGIWSSATFNSPQGIVIDSAGIVYVTDTGNNLLRKIAPSATNNTLFYANSTDIWRLNPPATSFYLTSTTNLNGGLAYDGTTIYATRDNSIYAYNTLTTASYTLVGSSAGYANGTSGVYFNMPIGLAIDSSGKNLYACDSANNVIRRVQISPLSVTTVASVSNPLAIALDSYSRYAYVANYNSIGSVYRVSLLQGNTTQIVTGLGPILGITIDATNAYAYITESSGIVIKINLQTFTLQTIAGSGATASIDGISLAAAFAAPLGIIYDPTTALMYSTDYLTGLIRTITTPIYLSTILGLEVIRTAPTITGTLTISGATVGGLLYNSGGPTASAAVIIGKGITLKTDLLAGNSTVTAKTFTASAGTSAGPYGYYYGDGSHVTSISDVRTKEDIRPIRNALSIVRKLQAVEYTKRDDPTRRWIGYIAQDIEELLPELVTTDDSPEKWKSVQYTNLPGLIIEAIKELKEKYRVLSNAANI